MEAISYVNIFETKGLEYLLVISFLVGFQLLVRYLGAQVTGTAEVPADSTTAVEDSSGGCREVVDCPYRTAFLEAAADLGDLDREEGAA